MFKQNDIPWNKGIKMSKERNQKISDSRKGIEPWNKGKRGICKIDICQRKCKSKDYCEMHYRRFKKHNNPLYERPNSLNSTSGFELHSILYIWSRYVRKRDNYTCQFCSSNDRLHSHHIFHKSFYPKMLSILNNGITLCQNCHIEYHSLNGK